MRFQTANLGMMLCVALVTLPVTAADWPAYRGPKGDGRSEETLGEVDWSADGPKVLWRQPTPLGFSSFAVAEGKAFTLVALEDSGGTLRQTVVAMNADTGETLWRFAMSESRYNGGGDAGAPGNRGGDGPRSTPTVSDGRVYAYDAQMLLVCLDAETGELAWRRDIRKDFAGRNIQWQSAACPVVERSGEGDALYIAGGGAGQSFLAFDKRNGEVLWKSGDEKFTHATPTLATLNGQRQVIFFMQSGLVGVDAKTGKEAWRTGFPYQVSTAASPVVAGDLVYCSAGYGVGAGLFRLSHAMQVEDVWLKRNELMNHWSTPVLHDGHLYGIYEHKKYGRAPLQCVELATGEIKWKQRGYGPGNCILVGDKLVVLSDAGEVAIVAATPDRYDELARAKVIDGKCWSTPAFAKGRIYVRSTEEGACIEL